MSRTALNGLVLGDIEKDFMLDLIRRYAKLYLVEILGYCLMGKHFHLIDLNPVRAGLVDRPEEYRWNSLGYHIQTGNKDNFLSLDFGLQEFGIMDAKERLRGYRRYVYEAGAVDRSGYGQRKVIGEMVVEKERKKEFTINKVDRFRCFDTRIRFRMPILFLSRLTYHLRQLISAYPKVSAISTYPATDYYHSIKYSYKRKTIRISLKKSVI